MFPSGCRLSRRSLGLSCLLASTFCGHGCLDQWLLGICWNPGAAEPDALLHWQCCRAVLPAQLPHHLRHQSSAQNARPQSHSSSYSASQRPSHPAITWAPRGQGCCLLVIMEGGRGAWQFPASNAAWLPALKFTNAKQYRKKNNSWISNCLHKGSFLASSPNDPMYNKVRAPRTLRL